MTQAAPRASSRIAASWTVIVTLAIIATELLLLHWVYDRADPVRHQRVGAAYVSGELVGRMDQGQATIATASVLTDLRKHGVSAKHVRAVSDQMSADGRSTDGTTRISVAEASVQSLRSTLTGELNDLDNEATGIYVVLLVLASLGWAVWFRRLVARHRSLQREMTEQQTQAVGERRLAALLRNAADLTMVCDTDLAINSATPAALRLLGVPPEELLGRSCLDFILAPDVELFESFFSSRRPGAEDTVAIRMPHTDGRVLRTEATLADLTNDPAIGGVVVTIRDVTARWMLEQQLSHDALHDALTGIGNRRLFHDRLEHALSRETGTHTVVFLDLDDFKSVNDMLGHTVGDRVLREVAARLASLCRTGDTVARLGGDEFALLLEGTNALEAEQLGRRLLDTVGAHLTVEGTAITMRASVGLASATAGVIDADTALRNADVAMYHAKRLGPGKLAHYEEGLHAREIERLQLRAELERGINDNELVLHYQPIVRLDTGRIIGLEALVRWEHPTRGLLQPLSFIPLAEESGLISQLGSWVLRRAVTECAALVGSADPIRISVNVAAPQLAGSHFVDEVRGVLAESGLAPQRLCLEITESSLVRDLDEVRGVLAGLRALGVQVAVDDFGTGYSSLSYLANLPIDILKIDKSFLDRVNSVPREALLAEAIIALGRTLGMATTAEGVEMVEQAAWLRETGCVYGQGFLWSRPVPFPQFEERLAAERREALSPAGA